MSSHFILYHFHLTIVLLEPEADFDVPIAKKCAQSRITVSNVVFFSL
jgi:hypothetical protein